MATKIFWGLVVESGKSYTQNVGTPFAIRMACLEESSDKKSPPSQQQQSGKNSPVLDDKIRVYAKYDKTDYLLCTLSSSRSIFQVPLHVKFETGSQLTLRVDGGNKKTNVHLTGFCLQSNSESSLSNSTNTMSSTPFSGQTQSILTSSKKGKEVGVLEDGKGKKRVSIEDADDIIISNISKFNNSSTVEESDDDDEDEDEDDEDEEENDALLEMMTSGLKNGGTDNKIPDFDKFLEGADDDDDDDDDEDATTEEDSDSDDPEGYAKQIAKLKKGEQIEGMDQDDDDDLDDDSDEDDEDEDSDFDEEDDIKHIFTQKSTPDVNKSKNATPNKNKSKLPVADSTPNSKTAKQQSNPSTPSADLLKTPEQNKQSPKTPSSAGHTPMKFVSKGGLMVQELKVGSGAVAKPGKMVAVYYSGRLKSNNKQFDKTQSGPGFKFRLGKGEVIKGWDVGVDGMKVGGKRRLIIPPNLAYGKKGAPPDIPPSSTLVFDVELRNVN